MVQGWVVAGDEAAGTLAPANNRKKSGSASRRLFRSPSGSPSGSLVGIPALHPAKRVSPRLGL